MPFNVFYNNNSVIDNNGYGKKSGVSNWFSSHPATDDRLKKLREFAAKYGGGGK